MNLKQILNLLQNFYLILVIILSYAAAYENNIEYSLSLPRLVKYLETEKILVADLKELLKSTKHHSGDDLKKEIIKIGEEHNVASRDMDEFFTNPVNIYKFLKRLHYDWTRYEEIISQNGGKDFNKRMELHRNTLAFPTEADVKESAVALLRLRKIYNLDVAQLASGVINGIKYSNGMSWSDCLVLGQLSMDMGVLKEIEPWLQESVKRYKNDSLNSLAAILSFIDTLSANLKKIYEIGFINSTRDENIFILPDDGKEQREYYFSDQFKIYKKLCRGEVMRPSAELRSLGCYYHWGQCDFCRLAPFKVEDINIDPIVRIFHGIISDQQIAKIKDFAGPFMKHSNVISDTGIVMRTSHRISSNAFITYGWHPYLEKIVRDLHDVTELNMTQNEDMQVAYYGPGGHYQPHLDCFVLSEVEQGGATVFPVLKISVKPSKGDVLFWYNLHRSLDRDYRTYHAGCPILKGSKWIANVWTRDGFQDVTRPCGLERDHEISVKYKIDRNL